MRDERREVRFDDGHRRGVGRAVVGDDALQIARGLARRAGLIEYFPPPRLDLLGVALGELAGETFRSAWTVQRCSSASGQSSRVAFQIPGAPSATA